MNFIFEKIEAICVKLQEMTHEKICDLDGFEYTPCEYKFGSKNENVPPENALWKPFAKNDRIGGKDAHFWFKATVTTPAKPEGDKQIVFSLKTSNEGTWDALNPQAIVYLDGKMMQGMDINHTELLLEFSKSYEMTVYFYTGMYDNMLDFKPSLYIVDKKIEKLYYDLAVPLNACRYLKEDSAERIEMLKAMETALSFLDLRVPFSKEFYASIDNVFAELDSRLYKKLCGKSDITVNCVGHTHIDVAWLWTLAQTREKAQRSFATVLNLMKQYPEYTFMSSQPQLYQYVKESAPELYEEIKQRVKEGRWEVEGAMWLEADCNLISGESMVRQIMFGKRFMKDEFGADSKILWLPDVFGYSAAMPQILKKCGIDKFVTSKISWNEFNRLPYDNFIWQGIDGSEIFTAFITAQDMKSPDKLADDNYTTYVGYIRPSQVLGAWKRFQQKEYSNETLLTFGFGDGGGGPTKDMLEQQRRLSYGLPGIPKTKIEFAGKYLERAEKKFFENAAQLRRMPKWVGELYLELHRGTYTSIAKNKKNNRKSELAYRLAESVSTIAMLKNGSEYPAKKINDGWQEILLNQFHDIIPGSSILEVYQDSDKAYKKVLAEAENIYTGKLAEIADNVKTDGGLLVYNPNGFAGSGVVEADGEKVYVENVPPMGYKVVKDVKRGNTVKVGKRDAENRFFRLVIDDNGDIVSIYDKRNDREIIKQGEKANQIQVFEDYPKCYDAWEITNYYKQKMWTVDELVSAEPINDGIRAGIRTVKRFLDSEIRQNIYLYEDIDRIDFETEIDWKQEHLLVKAAFPLDVYATEATYDIQFGNIKRPTHENTSWDAARFEVCAHKWADISDAGYGVSLLNDCKYGYSAEGSTLKLTLLKSATYPNPEADKELHSFTYSLYPHEGAVLEADTVRAAYELNQPLVCKPVSKNDAGSLDEEFSLVSCDSDNVMIETVKRSEDGSGVVIRLYEMKNRRKNIKLSLGFDFKDVAVCDMLENEVYKRPQIDGNNVCLEIGNYEIVTLKIV